MRKLLIVAGCLAVLGGTAVAGPPSIAIIEDPGPQPVHYSSGGADKTLTIDLMSGSAAEVEAAMKDLAGAASAQPDGCTWASHARAALIDWLDRPQLRTPEDASVVDLVMYSKTRVGVSRKRSSVRAAADKVEGRCPVGGKVML